MKKFTSVLLCLVLVLSVFCVNVQAAQSCIEASGTVAGDGTVTVTVSAKQAAANARLTVTFDSEQLTYVGNETAFAVRSARVDGEKLTVGLANATARAVKAGDELVTLKFEVKGNWDKTSVTVTAERFGGKTVNESVAVELTAGPRFEDVLPGQWFYEAVEHMAAEGYIRGVSATHFAPAADMNRAAFVTLLGRLEGVEETHVQTRFTDVPVASFFSGYVQWADEKGIVNGVSATLFAPAQSVTREQMVTFLYRYVVSEGVDVTVADPEAVLAKFPDAGSVSHWAKDAFVWAIDRGVINGMGGKLEPQGNANRAQVAVMLYRFFFEG